MSLRSPHDWFFCWLIHDFVSLLSKISDNLNFLFLTSDDCFNMRNIYCLPGSVLARRCKLSSMVWAAVWTWPCALKHYFDIFFADICRCKRSNRLESWEENNHTQHRGGEKVEVALRHIFLNRSHLQRQCHYIYAKTKCHYISLIAHFVSQVRSMWSSCGNRNDFKIKVVNICYDHLVNNCNVLQVEVNWIRRGLFPQRLGCPLAHRLLDLQESKGSCHLRFSGIRPLRGSPPPPPPS